MDLNVLAISVAVGSALISLLTYLQSGEAAQQRRLQNSAMRSIATRAALAWDHFKTAGLCHQSGQSFPDYQFPAARMNMERLEQSIDAALALGMFEVVMSTREHAVVYANASYAAFREAAEAKSPSEFNDALLKQHLLFGLLRMLEQCSAYRSPVMPSNLRKRYRATVKRYGNEPWTYLDAPNEPIG